MTEPTNKRQDVLDTSDHSRDAAGMLYVYPVVSRRAGGVSVGVNLNPNNACNFACVYCQVPDLVRGMGPEIDLPRLQAELDEMLEDIQHGDFMETRVPEGVRVLKDVAFSGNGEPTASPQFAEAVDLVHDTLERRGLLGNIKVVLITNGTLASRPAVQRGLKKMAAMNGEAWFKLDRGTDEGIAAVNQLAVPVRKHLERLDLTARACPTWVQTCMFGLDGEPPSEEEVQAYLDALKTAQEAGTPMKGVLLYGLARPSMQPGAERLRQLDAAWMNRLGERIEALGLVCKVSI